MFTMSVPITLLLLYQASAVTDVQVEVAFRGPRLTSSVKGDKVIITPPTTAQRTIQVLSFKMFIIKNVSLPARATAPIWEEARHPDLELHGFCQGCSHIYQVGGYFSKVLSVFIDCKIFQ